MNTINQTDKELKRLAEYNKEYGTAHEAVFKAKNDPKSS